MKYIFIILILSGCYHKTVPYSETSIGRNITRLIDSCNKYGTINGEGFKNQWYWNYHPIGSFRLDTIKR